MMSDITVRTARLGSDLVLAQRFVAQSIVAKRNLWKFEDIPTARATVAWSGGRFVGMHRYMAEWKNGGIVLYSMFTWVRYSYRRRGLAGVMWARTLARTKPHEVHVTAQTDEGKRLVARLQLDRPDLRWIPPWMSPYTLLADQNCPFAYLGRDYDEPPPLGIRP